MTKLFKEILKNLLVLKNFMLMDLLPIDVTGHCNSVFFCFIAKKSFDDVSSNFNSLLLQEHKIFQ